MSGEEWRPVEGWPGYEISSHGRLGSWLKLPNETAPPTSRRILKGGRDKDGYRKAVLCRKGEPNRGHPRIAALVCIAFHGPRPLGMVVRHDNGRHDDDRASNLLWGTQKQNMADKLRHGTALNGERHPWATMSEATARAVLADLRAEAGTVREVAERHGVSISAAYGIRSRTSWKHIGGTP